MWFSIASVLVRVALWCVGHDDQLHKIVLNVIEDVKKGRA